jgi:apolipoprotein N-acyltransferase
MAHTGPLIWLFAGALLFAIVAHLPIPPLTWIALTMLVHASRSMRLIPGTAGTWLVLYVLLAIARRGEMPVPGPTYFVVVAVDTLVFVLAFTIDRFAAPKLTGVAATLVFPLALASIEFLRSRFTPGASWWSIAYSQYGFLSLMQLAAVAGVWGMTFAIGWFASTFELAWSHGFQLAAIRGPVMACGIALITIVSAGYVRLTNAPTDRPTIRAATLNRPVDLFVSGEMTRISEGRVAPGERERVRDKLSRLHEWFLEGTRREARAGARLIVWPEQNLLIFAGDEPAFLERARRVAADERVYLAMGMGTIHPDDRWPFENKLVLIDPAGAIVSTHVKTRPVMGWEANVMKRGHEPISIAATGDGRLAGAICFEADFPELIRRAGQGRADLLILAVNDWKAIKEAHFHMHVFRAIENGVTLVRGAASGLSGAVDPWGRVLAMSDFFAEGDRTMVAQIPMTRVPTLYARVGDLFAWACVAGLVLGLVLAAT